MMGSLNMRWASDRSADSADALRDDVARSVGPTHAAFHRVSQCDGRVEVSARNWAKGENQNGQGSTCRDSVSQKSDRCVAR
jgi:hypothetical protein